MAARISGPLRAAMAIVLLALLAVLALPAEAAREKGAPRTPKTATGEPQAAPQPATQQGPAPAATTASPPPASGEAAPAPASPAAKAAAQPSVAAGGGDARETVEADVSTRAVAVTSAFRGSELVIFGTVVNSRQESAESGLYDVVIVVEGGTSPAIVRRKSNVAGIWLNTRSLKYDRVPSYYAIVSTRPLEEVADEQVLAQNLIGFDRIRFEGALGASAAMSEAERAAFRSSIVRLKQKEGL